MSARPALLDDLTIEAWLQGHRAWYLRDGHLIRDVSLSDYEVGTRLVFAQRKLAARLDHHALITLGYRQLCFDLWTHDRGGLTHLDLDFAEGLDDLMREHFATLT